MLAVTIVGSAHAVTIATVPVGYTGNAPDPLVMHDGTTGYGAVPYNYSIGTYLVTNAQYAQFLNAKASVADPYQLWNQQMGLGYPDGAITRSGFGPYAYRVLLGWANKPVVYVSWFDAIRFVNWLTNGQGSGDTETGSYNIAADWTVTVPDEAKRASWAASAPQHWVLPSENEWYKAAYYSGVSRSYYAFPFQSNSLPAALAPPGNSNSGNFFDSVGPITHPAQNYDGNGSDLTDAGAYPNSVSPSGAYDMGGGVLQWNEAFFDFGSGNTGRGLRGGDYINTSTFSGASYRFAESPNHELNYVGFRVASVGSVPEPSTGLLAALACGMIWFCRQRFKIGSHDAASCATTRASSR
jgi:formylglycine-generating enzyme